MNDKEKQTIYPIVFKDDICPHCLEQGQLYFLTRYGDLTKRTDIYAIETIACKKCGTEFTIKWEPDENNKDNMIPRITSHIEIEKLGKHIADKAKENKRVL